MRRSSFTTPEYGTVRQAALRFGIGEKLLRQRIGAGEIPSYSAGTRRMRVRFSDIEAWLKTTRAEPRDAAEIRHAELVVSALLGRRSGRPETPVRRRPGRS